MQLLVSVRCRTEVAAAVEGGADIVDAKEPARGSLGAVSAAVLADIMEALPAGVPLSVALGDLGDEDELDHALAALRLDGSDRLHYLKIGFAGVAQPAAARATIARAVTQALLMPGHPRVIAVAYADHVHAASLSPAAVTELAVACGAGGVLLDTWTKDGRDLFTWISSPALGGWIEDSRRAGLLTAVAGSLGPGVVSSVTKAGPDIVGIRGAACEGGRLGSVAARRVQALRAVIPASPAIEGSCPG